MRTLAILAVVAACHSTRPIMAQGDPFRDPATPVVELAQSPTGTSGSFDFCTHVDNADAPELTNAAWLAFLSADEYAHMFYVGTLLGALGFGNPDGGGLDWPGCATDLRVLRAFEADHAHELAAAHAHAGGLHDYLAPLAPTWGACARAWFDSGRYDGARYPAASFETYLNRTAHPGAYVEFFSGGEYSHDGERFVEGSTQVVVARHRTLPLVIVAFRGTEPSQWNDVLTDLKSWRTPLDKHGWPAGWGSVHAGFRAAFDSVGDVLRAKLDEYAGQGLTIWVTGHSLGGGLATLMGAEILRRIDDGQQLELAGVYTFGSPRVGDRAFHDRLVGAARDHRAQLVRFRNGDDVVTAIPKMGYEHVGVLAHLGEDTLDLVVDHDLGYGGLGSLADHNIAGWNRGKLPVSGYYRRLRELAKKAPRGCTL